MIDEYMKHDNLAINSTNNSGMGSNVSFST